MNAPVLVINCGSSSIKNALIDSADHSGPEVWVIPTHEEGRIAMETHLCVENS
ncbi:hypothetical protein HVA01_20540 [Halovibrio variabilis]|uniref:Butyrate kinase n=1 Tax=Halovibrio variabilis TaxID=31910 RepID=A0A511URT9_9GAMM|nr:hypothetical protein [Halovibrio variabilis]GEN28408.1 hypothetical protein HVA01_20540 [Halovibrio variabilis]